MSFAKAIKSLQSATAHLKELEKLYSNPQLVMLLKALNGKPAKPAKAKKKKKTSTKAPAVIYPQETLIELSRLIVKRIEEEGLTTAGAVAKKSKLPMPVSAKIVDKKKLPDGLRGKTIVRAAKWVGFTLPELAKKS